MPNDEMYGLFVIHVDDRGLDQLIETGLNVMVDDINHRVVVPFRDEITAEEVARILCGILKRETAP